MSNWGNSLLEIPTQKTLSNKQNFTQNERDQGKLTTSLFPSCTNRKDNTEGHPATYSIRYKNQALPSCILKPSEQYYL